MLNKIKLALVTTLALVMCFASVPSAFAADSAKSPAEGESAQVAITKILQMPIGTITPTTDFSFTITKVSVDTKTDGTSLGNMPGLNNSGIAFTTENTGDNAGDVKTVILQSEDLFKDIEWPHAGVYVYDITEIANAAVDASPENFPAPGTAVMTNSQAKYELTVFVKAGGPDGFYVSEAGAVRLNLDDGIVDEDNVKVDPGLKTGNDYSKMAFTNVYYKVNNTPDLADTDTASALFISKEVTGDLADHSLYFDYTITLTRNSLVPAPVVGGEVQEDTPISAYVVENGAVVDPDTNAVGGLTGTGSLGQCMFVSNNGTTNFSLKTGQRLVIVDLPVGTGYTVTETGVPAYTATATIGGTATAGIGSDNTAGDGLTTEKQWVADSDTNFVKYVNERQAAAFTGIPLTDLPYIGMIVLAVAALIGFIVAKSRKRKAAGAQA